jgi:chromosome segregation ATPase
MTQPQSGGVTLPRSKREELTDEIQGYQTQIVEMKTMIADYENELRALGSRLKQVDPADIATKAHIKHEIKAFIMNKRFILGSIRSAKHQIERLQKQLKEMSAARNSGATRRAHRGGSRHSGTRSRSAERSGNSRNPQSLLFTRIRDVSRQIENDRRELENIESKIDALSQDVEVLQKKLNEQRANNLPARKQVETDLRKKERSLDKEKEWRTAYKYHVRDGEMRLRVLLRSISTITTSDAAT